MPYDAHDTLSVCASVSLSLSESLSLSICLSLSLSYSLPCSFPILNLFLVFPSGGLHIPFLPFPLNFPAFNLDLALTVSLSTVFQVTSDYIPLRPSLQMGSTFLLIVLLPLFPCSCLSLCGSLRLSTNSICCCISVRCTFIYFSLFSSPAHSPLVVWHHMIYSLVLYMSRFFPSFSFSLVSTFYHEWDLQYP